MGVGNVSDPLGAPTTCQAVRIAPGTFRRLSALPRRNTCIFSHPGTPAEPIAETVISLTAGEMFGTTRSPGKFAFRSMERCRTARLLGRNVGPGIIDEELKRASMIAALGVCFGCLPDVSRRTDIILSAWILVEYLYRGRAQMRRVVGNWG